LVPAGSQNIIIILIFALSCLVFSQIWLNLLVDHLFRYNTKLGGKKNPRMSPMSFSPFFQKYLEKENSFAKFQLKVNL
jgi:hypothetical protein